MRSSVGAINRVPLSDPYRRCHTEFIPRLLGVTLNSFPCLWSPSLSPNERLYGNINRPMGWRFLECHLSECGTIQMGLLLGGPEWNQISAKWSLPAEVHRILPLRFSGSKGWWEVYFAFGGISPGSSFKCQNLCSTQQTPTYRIYLLKLRRSNMLCICAQPEELLMKMSLGCNSRMNIAWAVLGYGGWGGTC